MKNIKELNKEFKQLDIELFDCATEIVSYRRKIESIENNLHDFAGIRIVCTYIDDIYMDSAYKCSMYLLKRYGIMSIPYDEYGSYLRFSLIFKEEDDVFFLELKNRLNEMRIVF